MDDCLRIPQLLIIDMFTVNYNNLETRNNATGELLTVVLFNNYNFFN